jgi:hypothetical protein
MNPPKINYLQTTEGAVSFDRITTEPPPNFQLRVGHHLLPLKTAETPVLFRRMKVFVPKSAMSVE